MIALDVSKLFLSFFFIAVIINIFWKKAQKKTPQKKTSSVCIRFIYAYNNLFTS